MVGHDRMTLNVTACQPGWEEMENLRGNLRNFEEIWKEIWNNLEWSQSGRRPPQLMSPWVMMMLMRWYLSPPCYFHWEAYLRNYAYFGTPYSSAYILESTRRGGRLVPFGSVLFNTLSNISENILTYDIELVQTKPKMFFFTKKRVEGELGKGEKSKWNTFRKTQQALLFKIGEWSVLNFGSLEYIFLIYFHRPVLPAPP